MKRTPDLCTFFIFPEELWFFIASYDVKCAAALARVCQSLRKLVFPFVQAYKEPFETFSNTNCRLDFRFLNEMNAACVLTTTVPTFGHQMSHVLCRGNEIDLCFFRFNACVLPVRVRLSIVCGGSQPPQVYIALFVNGQRQHTLFPSTVTHMLNIARQLYSMRNWSQKHLDGSSGYEALLNMLSRPAKHDAKREINPLLC